MGRTLTAGVAILCAIGLCGPASPAATLNVADVTNTRGDGPDGKGNTGDDTWQFWFALAHAPKTYHRLDVATGTMSPAARAKGVPRKIRGPIGAYLPNPKNTEGWIYHSDWDGRFEGVWGDSKADQVIAYPYVEKNSHCPVAITYRPPTGGSYDVVGKVTDIQVVKHRLHKGFLWRVEIAADRGGKTSPEATRIIGTGGPLGDEVGPESEAFSLPKVALKKGELIRLVIDPNKWWGTDMTRVELRIVPAGTPPRAGGKGTKVGKGTKSVPGLIATKEQGWPQWRGPRRDGICNETALLGQWPPAGPKVLWSVNGLGRGWSSPIIGYGKLYITGDVGSSVWIYAYDLDGKLAWKVPNGRAWKKSYAGARASCLLSDGRLYHMNTHGRVVCLDAATGKALWTVDTFQRFGAKTITWGHSECLLVDAGRLIVTPGGTKTMMAALDKLTGKTLWTTGPLGSDGASYSSPVLFTHGGLRHLVSYSSAHAFGVNADTGKLLWTTPRPTRYRVLSAPAVYHDGTVFLTSPDGKEAEKLRLRVSGQTVKIEQMWTSELNCLTGGVVLLDGRLYGSGYRKNDGWYCLDAATGKTLYTKRDLNSGAVLYADGLLYCTSERGEMALLKPTDKGFETKGRFTRLAKRVKDAWAHPVIYNGRLYLRYHDTLWCHEIADPKRPGATR